MKMLSSTDKICDRCFRAIEDEFYLKLVNSCCHLSCLKCSECGSSLENEERCFNVDQTIVCRRDYLKRRFSSAVCFGCQTQIELDDLVVRFDQFLFHADCLNCSLCQNHLVEGDEFVLKDSLVYCRDHFNELDVENEKSTISIDSGYQTSPNSRSNSQLFCCSRPIDFDQIHRQKRLRTSFKQHQIRYLKCYFNYNHNPDSKELKALSEKINLPKRVLQVWFQNARAKFRRCSTFSSKERPISSTVSASCSNDLLLSDECSNVFIASIS